MMRVSKRKGFTLVELLIVIVVIGILASAMMLASGGATDSAKASAAISELRSAKAAGMMWFADDATRNISSWGAISGSVVSVLAPYMDNTVKAANILVVRSADGVGPVEAWIGLGEIYQLDLSVLKKIETQGKGAVYFTATAPYINGARETAVTGDAIFMRVK